MQEIGIREAGRAMEAGRLSAEALLAYYLERIERLDRAGPALRAVIALSPQAEAEARALDRERREQGPRGPLHGIPLLIKDNIETADGCATTAGSLALAGLRAEREAGVVSLLRAAGALILGKANLSEWANFRSSRSSSGWSSVGGQTRNPYALDRNPCGSSSGSAVGVAADLCTAAVGTETDGSIICPAQANGIVGIKPTVGLVGRSGIVPIAHSQDTAGPMARGVADAALLLGAMAGLDPRDPATKAGGEKGLKDYRPFLEKEGLKGARIGVARSFFGFHDGVDRLMEKALAVMSAAGAVLVDPVAIEHGEACQAAELELLLYEFKADINGYLGGLGPEARVRSLEDLIAFNEAHREQVMPFFGQELLEMAQAKGPLSEEAYQEARATCLRLARTEGIDRVLAEHEVEAIVAPSGGPAWLTDWVNGDHFSGGSAWPAAVAGYPSITVPAGSICGLPVGISFFGGAWQEGTLIRLAFAFEQRTRHRVRPGFLPSAAV